jgi:acyl carrier protein
MQEPEIYSALTEVFRDVFDNDSLVLTPEVMPSDFPGWDSARYIALVVATEARFGIRFQPVELEAMRTVADFAGRVHSKI